MAAPVRPAYHRWMSRGYGAKLALARKMFYFGAPRSREAVISSTMQ
jgi:hypothetical protein